MIEDFSDMFKPIGPGTNFGYSDDPALTVQVEPLDVYVGALGPSGKFAVTSVTEFESRR